MAVLRRVLGRGEGTAPVTAAGDAAGKMADEVSAGTPVDAATVCEWLAHAIERGDRPDARCVAYGGEDSDPILVGAEHLTTILVQRGGTRQWFRVEIQEFDPNQLPLHARHHAVLATLQRRATGEVRVFDPGVS